MQTPYQILGVARDASDAAIKQAYLQQVKLNPPDRDAEKFQQIHNAFQAIKDHQSRVGYDLFTLPQVDFNTLLDAALQTDVSPDINADAFKEILNIAADDEAQLLRAIT